MDETIVRSREEVIPELPVEGVIGEPVNEGTDPVSTLDQSLESEALPEGTINSQEGQ